MGDEGAVDEAALFEGGEAEGVGGEAVEVSHGAVGGLMQEGQGVGVEEVAVAAGAAEAEAEVVGGVAGEERVDAQAGVEAGEEGAVFAQGESVGELGESDENQGQQGLGVPFVVEQDVQVVEGVLVQEMGFVEEEDGVAAFGGELLDVGGDGVKDAGGGGGRRGDERADGRGDDPADRARDCRRCCRTGRGRGC